MDWRNTEAQKRVLTLQRMCSHMFVSAYDPFCHKFQSSHGQFVRSWTDDEIYDTLPFANPEGHTDAETIN